MERFISNKIELNNDSISNILKKAREEKKINLDDVSKTLKIRKKYLEALESGRFEKLPPGVYGKNFLKEYAQFLHIDPKDILEPFEQETKSITNQSKENLFSRKIPSSFYFLTIPKIIKNFIIALIVVVCVVYIGYYVKNIVSPPNLIINYPIDNLTTKSKVIEVRGNTEKEAEITINGKPVLADADGNFTKSINLTNGLNTITIISRKKYGKENIITKKILVKDELELNY